MKTIIYLFAFLLVSCAASAQIDLTFGAAGSTPAFQQSYNEARGVDIKVLSQFAIHVTAMTLSGYYTFGNNMAWIGARIYDPVTHALLASGQDTVQNWTGADITIPVTCTLQAFHTYRVGFYCNGPTAVNGAFQFQPDTMPYNDQYNFVQIQHAYDSNYDTIPSNDNIFVPFITINASGLGIAANGVQTQVSVYPNPATTSTTISFINPAHTPCTLKLYNAQGQLVQTTDNITTGNITLQRNSMPPGLYFFKLSSAGSISGNGKFVWK